MDPNQSNVKFEGQIDEEEKKLQCLLTYETANLILPLELELNK